MLIDWLVVEGHVIRIAAICSTIKVHNDTGMRPMDGCFDCYKKKEK